jgi:hypothetical protein
LNFANVYNNGLFTLAKFVVENASYFEMPTWIGFLGWHDINIRIPICLIWLKEAENISSCVFLPKEGKESEVHNHNKVLMAFAPLNFANVYNNGFFTLTKFVAKNVGNIQTWV